MLKLELLLLQAAAVSKTKRRMWAPYRPQNPVNFSWYFGMKRAATHLVVLPAGLTTWSSCWGSGSVWLGWKQGQDCFFQRPFSLSSSYLQYLIASLRCRHSIQLCLQHPRAPGPAACLPAPAWGHPQGLLTSLKIISARNSFILLCPGNKLRKLPGQQGIALNEESAWTRQER